MYIYCMLLMMSKLIMCICTSVHLCVSMHLSMCILLQMSVTVLYSVYKLVHTCNILHVHCSSGSRGGSMGSYELPFYSRPVNDVHTVANLLQKHPSASVPTAEFAFSLCKWSNAYLALSARCPACQLNRCGFDKSGSGQAKETFFTKTWIRSCTGSNENG